MIFSFAQTQAEHLGLTKWIEYERKGDAETRCWKHIVLVFVAAYCGYIKSGCSTESDICMYCFP